MPLPLETQMHIQDSFESALVVESASGEVDGRAILAKVRGPFFVPDGMSRNRRFYPRSLWEKTLARPEVAKRLQERRMFGTIGHEQEINDQALLEGKISHIVTRLWIDERGRGMGEALVLNSPAGHILNSVFRAGGKLFVSSRARGEVKEDERRGVPVVDEDTYMLGTFDVVLDPGFLEANPSIAESLGRVFGEEFEEDQGDVEMVNERLIRENEGLKASVDGLSADLKASKSALESATAAAATAKSEADARIAKLTEDLRPYAALGTAEKVTGISDEVSAKLAASEQEVARLKGIVDEYAKLGTVKQLDQTIEKAKEFRADLDRYEALGDLKSLEEVLRFVASIKEERAKAAADKEIDRLAKELSVDRSIVAEIYGKVPDDRIKAIVAGMRNVERWKPEAAPVKPTEDAGKESKFSQQRAKPMARSIMEGFYSRPLATEGDEG